MKRMDMENNRSPWHLLINTFHISYWSAFGEFNCDYCCTIIIFLNACTWCLMCICTLHKYHIHPYELKTGMLYSLYLYIYTNGYRIPGLAAAPATHGPARAILDVCMHLLGCTKPWMMWIGLAGGGGQWCMNPWEYVLLCCTGNNWIWIC